MFKDSIGFLYFDEEDFLREIYKNPDFDVSSIPMMGDDEGLEAQHKYEKAVSENYDEYPHFETAVPYATNPLVDRSVDMSLQSIWKMPDEYKLMDIAEWVLSQCETEAELQRCGEELMMFQERNMFGLLQYLKYFVDTMRENNIVWGVGRGSSVASYVLYLIGIHKVNSLYYDLSIKEFLRDGESTSNSTG